MRRQIYIMFVMLLAAGPVHAEWVDVTGNLGETDIQAIAVDPKDTRVLYAASEKRLYKTLDTGDQWKQLLSVRGSDNRIHFILINPRDPRYVYVASDRGIQFSQDGGKKWENIYRGTGEKAKAVYCLSMDTTRTGVLWAGTAAGLVRVTLDPREVKKVEGFPETAVFSLLQDDRDAARFWAGTEKGIYKSIDSGAHWQRVQTETRNSMEGPDETSLSQFQVEEISFAPAMANLVHLAGNDKFYAATAKGILQGDPSGDVWTALRNGSLPDEKVNYLARSSDAFYAATDKGAFRWNEENGLKDISDGLTSKEVRMLTRSAASGDLFAATKKGIFRYPKPDFKPGELAPAKVLPEPGIQEVLKRFESEPTIRQVQAAAIQYAEVHPDKIRQWREAASRKAWMPTVSLSTDMNADENVDLDRGGTADPDRFIIGPKEKSLDWHVGLSWNLGELVWNDDQTSIDTRSKLMAELRDDVLNEVTHLYYERRRLQVEMLITPAKELPLQLERQIKLEELTANINALTGGPLFPVLEVSRG